MNYYILSIDSYYLHRREYFQLLSTLWRKKKESQQTKPYIAASPAAAFISHLISSTQDLWHHQHSYAAAVVRKM